MTLDVLAVGAHPDDVELGCGGTLTTIVDAGYRVGVLNLTEARLSTRGDVETRRKEAAAAAGILGVRQVYQLGLAESSIISDPDSLQRLTALLRELRPHVVLAPYRDDRHPDHRDTCELVQRACFWSGVARYGSSQPPHRPHRICQYFLSRMGEVSLVVDISAGFDRKLRAIRAFRSQFVAQVATDATTFISRPEFLDGLISRARYFGSLIGAEYGEPLYIREMNRVEDLVSWAGQQGIIG